MQAHDLHQHLVRVRGAVKRAGARRVIRRRFDFEQLLACRLAFGVQLSDFRFLLIADAARHRPGRNEDRRQMTECQRGDQQARHDLVADAEKQRGVEHVVRQRDRGRQRNHVAREQRQLHACPALRDAIAHRRHATGNLRGRADVARGLADQIRIALERLMRREHVVVGRDDGDIRAVTARNAALSPYRWRQTHAQDCRTTDAVDAVRRRAQRRCAPDTRRACCGCVRRCAGDLGDDRIKAH